MQADQPPRATGLRLFASTIDEPRARRASDVLLLVGSVLGLVLLSVVVAPPPQVTVALGQLVASLPPILDPIWQVFADLLVIAPLALLAAVALRRRGAVLRDMALAVVAATVVWQLAGRSVSDGWPAMWEALGSTEPPPWYPSPRVVLAGAVFMTASPHLTLPMRRLGRFLVGWGAVSLVLLGATTAIGAVAGLLVAAIAAAAVHLAVGSSGGRPGLEFIRASLAELGVAVGDLGAADRQVAGLFRVETTDLEGRPLVVKVYGRDAGDSALVQTVWRKIWYREAGAPLRFGRLRQVEHEAFLTLFTAQAGIATDTVVTAGATADDDALLVLRRAGTTLDAATGIDDTALVDGVWEVVRRLHDIGLAHGQLDPRRILVSADSPRFGVVDLRGGALGASPMQLRTDEVQALVTTALLTGVDAAAAGVRRALGADGVATMLPFLQVSVLTAAQQHAIRSGDLDLDALRSAVAAAADLEAPELVQLRRMTLGSVVRVVLPAIAIIALLSALAGLDRQAFVAVVREASWWLVGVGVVVAQVPRLTQSVSTLGASPIPLPLGPVYALQLAVSYINLAIPSSAARMAVNIRFFQRHGVPPGTALTAGALDGFSGFIVQALILAGLLLLTPASLDIELDQAVDSATTILILVVVLVAAAISVVVAVGRIRRFVVRWVRQLGQEALAAVRGLRSPRRLVLLFGGNLATEVLFALTLGTFVRAVGYPVGLEELLIINIGVALLSGLMPIPGGIGVAEGGLTFGLVQAGVPDEVALSAVLLYRLATFYLPPVWGFFALRWLERNEHL